VKDKELSEKREEAFEILYRAIKLLKKRRILVKKIGEIKKTEGFKVEDYSRESEIFEKLKPNKSEEILLNTFLLDSLKVQGWSLGSYQDSENEIIKLKAELKPLSVEDLKALHSADYITVMGSRKQVFIAWLLSLKNKRIELLDPVGRSWEDIAWSMLIRPYRIKDGNVNKLPAFAQYPNRFGTMAKSVFELKSYSLVDLTFSSEKKAIGESVYMYSPACVAGKVDERTIVFSNNKKSFESLTKTYRKSFGATESLVDLCDEKALRKECEKAEPLYREFEAVKWEDGPFIALSKKVKGSINASSYGNYSGIYVLNMLRP